MPIAWVYNLMVLRYIHPPLSLSDSPGIGLTQQHHITNELLKSVSGVARTHWILPAVYNSSDRILLHMRQKRVARTDVQYLIDNEEIPMVDQYRYLGCVVDEHLELKSMVEERAWAGKRALGAWFHRCRTELGEVGVRP